MSRIIRIKATFIKHITVRMSIIIGTMDKLAITEALYNIKKLILMALNYCIYTGCQTTLKMMIWKE